jgi:protein AATF/BFR2
MAVASTEVGQIFSADAREHFLKAQGVLHQTEAVEELLRFRMELQKAVYLGNQLNPIVLKEIEREAKSDKREGNSMDCSGMELQEIRRNLKEMIKSLLAAQSAIYSTEIEPSLIPDANLFRVLQLVDSKLFDECCSSVDQAAASAVTSAKLKAATKFQTINQPVRFQVENALETVKQRSLIRLDAFSMTKMEDAVDPAEAALDALHLPIKRNLADEPKATAKSCLIYDDSKFLANFLKHSGFFSETPGISSRNLLHSVSKENSKKRRIDTKASKGRKLRYDPHPKLQNLMVSVAVPCWNDQKCDELFGSLFA